MPSDCVLDAGPFSTWLRATGAVAAGEGEAEVPCGTCTACCRASYFVHVAPEDVAARRRIPAELLFPAPGRPAGHLLMGYDDKGRCPMLADHGCSIYEDRPRTCRAFDCRVHAAAGTTPDGPNDADIAVHVRRWRFRFDDRDERETWVAVRLASRHIDTAELPHEIAPRRAADLAVAALQAHELFLDGATPSEDELAEVLFDEQAPPI